MPARCSSSRSWASAKSNSAGGGAAGLFVQGAPMAIAIDDRLHATSRMTRLLRRPELGALAGTVLVIIIFAIIGHKTGLFTPRGIINVLQISAELGILATAVALLMIGGEFDLSIGSPIGFAGIVIGVGVTVLHIPLPVAVAVAFG